MAAINVSFNISAKELSDLVDTRNEGSLDEINKKHGGIQGLAKLLRVDTNKGLSSNEILQRQEIFGSNKIPMKKSKSFFHLCFEAIQDPTLIVLMLCAVVSLSTGIYEAVKVPGHSSDWVEGLAILITIFIVVMVAAGTDFVKEKQFRALSKIASDIKVSVLRNGKDEQVSIYDLVVGDIMWVRYGDLLPSDGILIESQQIKVDESALTGEPVLINKSVDEHCMMLSGTKIMEGSGKMMVIAVGKWSQAGIIKTLASGQGNIKSWKVLDGTVNVTSGSSEITYNGKTDELKLITPGSQIKVLNITSATSKDKKVDKNVFTLEKPFEGVTTSKVQVSYIPYADEDGEEEEEESVLQSKLIILAGLIGQIGTAVAVLVVIIMTIVYLVQVFAYHDPAIGKFDWTKILGFVITGVTILVVAVPEGLPLAVTLSLAFSVQKMLGDNNLVKHLDACETMGSATTICSDKTGTLTTNRMTVMKGYMGKKFFDRTLDVKALGPEALRLVSECISLNSGKTTIVKQSESKSAGNPKEYLGNMTECAMINMIMEMGVDYEAIRNDPFFNYPNGLKLFPFNSTKKRMSIIVKNKEGSGFIIYTKGASEVILDLCSNVLMQDGSVENMTKEEKENINKSVIDQFADEAYRTLSLAFSYIPDNGGAIDWENADQDVFEKNLTFICVLGIEDPLREEVPAAILACNTAGIIVRMVTGDNIRTARSIARKCKIIPDENPDRYIVMEGSEFRKKVLDSAGNLMQSEFDKIWPRLRVLARSSPKDKYTLITGLLNSELHIAKLEGKLGGTLDYLYVTDDKQVVAVTGDGTNDAPALAKADVGFAMGIVGTEVAKDACDIVLLDDNFGSIVKSVKWGRNVYDSIGKFLQFQLTVNVCAITIAVIGALSRGDSPLAAVQLLWVNLIMDALGSLALATEAPSDALLLRKPYGRNDPVLNSRMLKNVCIGSLYQLAVVLFLLYGQISIPTLFMTYGDKTAIDPINNGNTFQLFSQCDSQAIEPFDDTSPYNMCVTRVRNTILFNAFVMMQLANEINSRKLHDELNVFEGIHKNFVFIGVELITLVIQILLVQFGGVAFQVEPLNALQWGVCLAFGLGMFPWGVIMHLIPPFSKKKLAVGQDTIVAGAKDEDLKDISINASISNSKRVEAARQSNRLTTQTSTKILSQARQSIKQGNSNFSHVKC